MVSGNSCSLAVTNGTIFCHALITGDLLAYGIKQQSVDPDSKVHGANMGPIWGRQDPGGPHVGAMIFAIWATNNNQLHCTKS